MNSYTYLDARHLDADIAEDIMGMEPFEVWEYDEHPDGTLYGTGVLEWVPYFSTQIGAAWMVVQKLVEKGLFVCMECQRDGFYRVGIHEEYMDALMYCHIVTESMSMPMAICLAAMEWSWHKEDSID